MIFMSPPMKLRDILFLAWLSVCPSVCPSRSISFEPLVGITNKCKNVKYDEAMCSASVWPRSVQGQGHNLRLNIVWLYFVSALYLLNPWLDLQITLHKCQVWWDDVQCLCLTKVWSGSRSEFKINIVWLYFMLALYLLKPWLDLQITLPKCQEW